MSSTDCIPSLGEAISLEVRFKLASAYELAGWTNARRCDWSQQPSLLMKKAANLEGLVEIKTTNKRGTIREEARKRLNVNITVHPALKVGNKAMTIQLMRVGSSQVFV
jgi:L-asparaginase II